MTVALPAAHERWLHEEEMDAVEAAYYATKAAILDAGVRLVIPGDLASMALGLMLHPVIRNGMPKTLETWLRHQVPVGDCPQPAIVVPARFGYLVLWILMIPGAPHPLHRWVAEQIDRIGLDELNRNRIRRRMGHGVRECAR